MRGPPWSIVHLGRHRRSGYSHRCSSLVTRGITTQVISGTVTPVVTASRSTSGRLPSSGAEATTTRVISGKIVAQGTRAILAGGGGGAPGWVGRVNQPSRPVRTWVWIGPATWGSARGTQGGCSVESSQGRRWGAEPTRYTIRYSPPRPGAGRKTSTPR